MNKEKVIEIIIEQIQNFFDSMSISEAVSPETYLIGRKSKLDSMGLVNVIIDIESCFMDNNYNISLTSEKAMSAENSPFKNVLTLSDFIYEQIENNE